MLAHILGAIPKPTLPLRGRTSFPVSFPTDINKYTEGEPLPVLRGSAWIGCCSE